MHSISRLALCLAKIFLYLHSNNVLPDVVLLLMDILTVVAIVLMHFERFVKILLLFVFHTPVYVAVSVSFVLHQVPVRFLDHYILYLHTILVQRLIHGRVFLLFLSYSSVLVCISPVDHVVGVY